MKTIYLKATTKELLIADIAKVIKDYEGSTEFSNGTIHGHYIGQIAKTRNPETGEVTEWVDGFHANLLVPDNFDASVFESIINTIPISPVHKFA